MEIFDVNYVRHPVSFFVTGFLRLETAALARAYLGITAGGGDVIASGVLTNRAVILGNGLTGVRALGSLGTAGHVLTSNGAGVDPSFQAPAGGSGTVTNSANLTPSNAVVVADGGTTGVKTLAALGTAGDVLTSNGAGVPPSFQAPAGGGNVTAGVTLTDHGVAIGNGGVDLNITAVGATNTLLHGNTGADPTFSAVVEADITLANNTTNNVTIARHGFAPILPNDATKYLDGTGAYTVPAGGGGSGTVTNTGTLTDHGVIVGNGGVDVSALAVGTNNTVLHGVTGADPAFSAVVEADITLANNATNDVSTAKHGFAPILPNDATKFLDGTGAYTVPPGSGIDYFWDYMEASLLPITAAASFALNCTRNATETAVVNPTATEPPGSSNSTTASINNVATYYTNNVNQFIYNRPFEFRAITATSATITSVRLWGAFVAVNPGTVAASDLGATPFCGFRFSTGAPDTNWRCVFNDNAGNSESLDSGVAVAASTVYRFKITWDGTTTGKVKYYINGTLVQTSSFDFPTLTKFMAGTQLTTLANAIRIFVSYGIKMRQYYP